jgi:SAM-dependent MidA family methyltransferase
MPTDLQLQEYNSGYFKSAHGGHPKSSSAIAFFSGINKLRCEYISNILNKKNFKVSRILEIGPGKGYLASHWLTKYPKSTYYGVETDFTCHEILKKIGVKILLPEQVESTVEEVDLVIISHVLEHVSDPLSFLHIVTQKLKKGGALFIEVPCNDWQHKECDEPHLLFFNNKSITKCLKNIGFEQIQVNYFGQSIEKLKAKSKLQEIFSIIRIKLIDLGFCYLFSYTSNKDLALLTPIERASTRSFLAHKESEQASWWLRTVSFKL